MNNVWLLKTEGKKHRRDFNKHPSKILLSMDIGAHRYQNRTYLRGSVSQESGCCQMSNKMTISKSQELRASYEKCMATED